MVDKDPEDRRSSSTRGGPVKRTSAAGEGPPRRRAETARGNDSQSSYRRPECPAARPPRGTPPAKLGTSGLQVEATIEDERESRSERRQALRSEKREKFRTDASKGSKRKGWLFVGGPVLLMLAVGAIWIVVSGNDPNAKPGDGLRRSAGLFTAVTPEDGLVKFAIADFKDGKTRFYTYKSADDKSIDFFVMKSSDGVIRAAIDSCDVCFTYRKGYHQEGDEMVCNNCGQRFPSLKINVIKGGCNPAPLTRTTEGDTVIIKEKDIIADGSQYF